MPLPRVEIVPVGDRWEIRRNGTRVAESLTPIGAVTIAEGEIAEAAAEAVSFAYGSFLALRDRVVRLVGPIASQITPEEVEKGEALVRVKVPVLDSVIGETNRGGPWTRAIGRLVEVGARLSGSCCSDHAEVREAIDSFLALDRSEIARARRDEFAKAIADEAEACQDVGENPPSSDEPNPEPPTEKPS